MSEQARLHARDPGRSVLVQAPAGSGKTELLTQRILALLVHVDEPEEILALTFTRKAAAEMRIRVIDALNMSEPDATQAHKLETWRLAQAALQRSRERGWNLAEHASRLRLMTLDSLTHALAAQLPLLSGFGEMPVAGEDQGHTYRLAAERALDRLLEIDRDAAEALLLHLDHQAVVLISLVADMLAKREQWLELVIDHARDMEALRDTLESTLTGLIVEQLQSCDRLMPIEYRHALPPILAFAGEKRGVAELASLSAWPAASVESLPLWQLIAAELTTKDGLRKPGGINVKRGFPNDAQSKPLKQQFQQILGDLALVPGLESALIGLQQLPATSSYSEQQWQLMQALFNLLILAADELQQQFSLSGEADFTEIALRALRALEGEAGQPSDLLLRLDYRIHHILVDEFQDTSLLQMRLLRNLTAGWQEGDGRHRTLFMVGDPMQSIYRFRKAEVGLFLQAAENAAALPQVEMQSLERNFRSAPLIVDWVNRAFSAIFPPQQDAVRGAVKHAMAVSALTRDGRVCLHIQQPDEAGSEAEDAQEAAAITALVRQELAADATRRIAILARSRKHLHAIMPALNRAGIPFKATKLLPLDSCPEVRLLRAMARALLHPIDRESWAALLRSCYGGLNTAELLLLLGSDERPVWHLMQEAERLSAMEPAAAARVASLVAALEPCVEVAGRVGVRRLLESAWSRLGLAAAFDATAASNIAQTLELVAMLDEGGAIDFARFDEGLKKLFAVADSSAEASRVELMTMHGAKGLQWDVVLLPGLGKRGNNGDTPLLALTDVPAVGHELPLLALRAATRSDDALFSLVNGIEKSKYDYELARLLYVACTRAETSLHMFGRVSEKGQATSGSLLSLLLPGGADGGCFGAEIIGLQGEGATQEGERKPLLRMSELPELVVIEPVPTRQETEYLWAGPEAAPVGNAVHAILQQVAEKGIEQWSAADSEVAGLRMRRMLLAEGLSGESLESAARRCQLALQRVLASSRAAWLLSAAHRESHCEWALSSHRGGAVANHIIDRSFVDTGGTRWIVDYKTASHEGADMEAFLDEETKRHAAQLERYAATLRLLEPERPIRLALYFPMFDGWREWEPAHH